jgi:CPA1 family monovalent cation:H+ antiporter
MHEFEYILILLAAVLVSNLFGQRFPRVSTPLMQVALGVVLVASPVIPFEGGGLDPDLFLILFIAPMLFEEAKRSDKQALWRLRQPILSLAIGLVFATVMSVGFVLDRLVPSIPMAAAFAFAAALAPTDVVAVLSLKDTSTIPLVQHEILKGEGLLNDAASIVSFQFAIAAALTASFSLLNASASFVVMFIGGLALGVGLMLLRWVAMRFVTKSGMESSTFFVLFEIITPCLVYLVAEMAHVSGIVAVVAAGITYSFSPRGNTPLTARNAIVSSSAWSVIVFTLNGLCFLMLGAQLPHVIYDFLQRGDIAFAYLGLCMLVMLSVILLVRFVWAFIMARNVDMTDLGDSLSVAAAAAEAEALAAAEAETEAQAAAVEVSAEVVSSVEAVLAELAFVQSPPDLPDASDPLAPPDPTGPSAQPGLDSDTDPHDGQGDGLAERVAGWRGRWASVRQSRREQREKARSDPKYLAHHLFEAMLLTVAGPKGSITLALVFGIPLTLADGSPFPERDLIIFIASGVILMSLSLTSIAMPLVSPKQSPRLRLDDEVDAMIGIYRQVIHELLEHAGDDDQAVTNEVVRQYNERIGRLQATHSLEDSEELQLRAQIVTWERQHTLELVSEGRVGTWLGMYYLNFLGRQLARLEHHSTLRESAKAFVDQMSRIFRRWRLIRDARRDNPAYGKVISRLQLRGLMIENLNYVLYRLEAMQQDPGDADGEASLSPQLVDRFVFSASQQLARSSQRFRSRIRLLTGTAEGQAERERRELRLSIRAMEWEREAIADAVQAEAISRSTAKEMFDSVAAMELDIEGFLE